MQQKEPEILETYQVAPEQGAADPNAENKTVNVTPEQALFLLDKLGDNAPPELQQALKRHAERAPKPGGNRKQRRAAAAQARKKMR